MAEHKTIREMAIAALAKWQRKNTPEAIAERVESVMNKHAEELVMGVLGFRKSSWQREYEMDPFHDSVLKESIQEWARAAAEQWMETHKAEIVFEVAPSLVKAMASRYRNVAKEEIGRVVDEVASDVAANFARAAIAEILATEDMQITDLEMKRIFEATT